MGRWCAGSMRGVLKCFLSHWWVHIIVSTYHGYGCLCVEGGCRMFVVWWVSPWGYLHNHEVPRDHHVVRARKGLLGLQLTLKSFMNITIEVKQIDGCSVRHRIMVDTTSLNYKLTSSKSSQSSRMSWLTYLWKDALIGRNWLLTWLRTSFLALHFSAMSAATTGLTWRC